MKSKRIIPIFFILILSLSPTLPFVDSAGYGEENENLGQFVDDFENLDNVTVIDDLVRNATSNAIELNYTIGIYGDYTHYMRFDIDYNRINSNLTKFPVLLEISDRAGISDTNITSIFDEIGDSYLKIAVTSADLGTEYYVDVEYWSASERQGYLWISPDVSSLENTSLILHYSSAVVNNTSFVGLSGSVVAQNVWDTDYLTVLHMADETTSSTLDSTQYNNDGVKKGANEPIVRKDGMIDSDQNFDGNDDTIVCDDWVSLTNRATWELWIYPDRINVLEGFISKRIGANDWQIYTGADARIILLIWGTTTITHDMANYFSSGAGKAYCVSMVYDGTWVYFYRNGTQVYKVGSTGNINNANIDIRIGDDWYGNNFDGYLDEIRISNTSRSGDWLNSTWYSDSDDFVYWSIEISGGYETEGYLITTNYLDYAPGNSLALLTNTTIPDGTTITVQFSNDNLTWSFNDWDPIFGGLEAIDLRVLNYADIYVMFNYTGTVSTTPTLYQSRLITTRGNVSHTIDETNVTGEWFYYNLTTINVIVGTHDSGDINSTLDIDGDTYDCSEVNGAPGYQIEFEWTDVDQEAHCVWVCVYIFYDGVSAHTISIDLWNFTATAWVTIGTIYDMVGFEWVNSSIYDLRMPNDFINSTGGVRGRFNHVSNGNPTDDIYTEFLKLYAFIPFENGAVAAVTEQSFFWIFVAIVLSIITALLVWMKYGDSNI